MGDHSEWIEQEAQKLRASVTKQRSVQAQAAPTNIPHTDLWPNAGGVAGSWDPTAAPTKDAYPLGHNPNIEKFRSDLRRKLDAMYREQQSAMQVVQDYEGRIQRLNILLDDLR